MSAAVILAFMGYLTLGAGGAQAWLWQQGRGTWATGAVTFACTGSGIYMFILALQH